MKNKKIINIITIIIILTVCHLSVFTQNIDTTKLIKISYSDYWKQILEKNFLYLSQKNNVKIADANIDIAKLFQNPNISFETAGNGIKYPFSEYGLTAEMTKTVELFPKRKSRINLAKSEKELAVAILKEFLQELQSQVTLDYLDALKNQYLFDVTQNSYLMMSALAEGDSIRYSLGSINNIDAIQSKIEAGILLNEMIQMDEIRKNSFQNLFIHVGKIHQDTIFIPYGSINEFCRNYNLNQLVIQALNNRADLEVAKYTINCSKNNLNFTKKNRLPDVDFTFGTTNNYTQKIVLTKPLATEIYAGISIPLPFSNFNKGEIKVAQYQIEQAELEYKQTELSIQNEVVAAYNSYNSLCKQVENFNKGLLEQAKTVLNGKIYSYNRGESSLLEVLNAQRTYNDLQISYYETLFSCYNALINLEKVCGFWDITLE